MDCFKLSNGDKLIFKKKFTGEDYANLWDAQIISTDTERPLQLGAVLKNLTIWFDELEKKDGTKVPLDNTLLGAISAADAHELLQVVTPKLNEVLGK